MNFWLRPKSVVLNTAPFSLNFLLLPPTLHWHLLPHKQTHYTYVPSHMYHTHFPFLQTVRQSGRQCRLMVQREQKTQDHTSFHSNIRITRKVTCFDNKHFLICHIQHYLVIQISIAKDNKQTSQMCRMTCESFIQQSSTTKELYKLISENQMPPPPPPPLYTVKIKMFLCLSTTS
jgi:hypothetical protein